MSYLIKVGRSSCQQLLQCNLCCCHSHIMVPAMPSPSSTQNLSQTHRPSMTVCTGSAAQGYPTCGQAGDCTLMLCSCCCCTGMKIVKQNARHSWQLLLHCGMPRWCESKCYHLVTRALMMAHCHKQQGVQLRCHGLVQLSACQVKCIT